MELYNVTVGAISLRHYENRRAMIENGGWQVSGWFIEKPFIGMDRNHVIELAKADLRYILDGGIAWLFPSKGFRAREIPAPQPNDVLKRWKLIPDRYYTNGQRHNVRSYQSLEKAKEAQAQVGGDIYETTVPTLRKID